MALSLILPASGCTSTVQDPFLTAATGGATGFGSAIAPPISSEIAPHLAIVALPHAAGRVVSVQQVSRKDGLNQTIVYANATAMAGDNSLTVEVASGDAKAQRPPTRGELRRDMAEVLPGIAMHIEDVIGDNAQGVFGYALGAAQGHGRCIYGWQVVKSGALVERPYAASLRLRFCDPSANDAQLISLMQGLRLMPVSGASLAALRQTRPLVGVAPMASARRLEDEPVEAAAPRRHRPKQAIPSSTVETAVDVASVAVPMPGEAAAPAQLKAVVSPPVEQAQTTTAAPIRDAVAVPLPQ